MAQHKLVPNGDFEQYDVCPQNASGKEFPKFWYSPSTKYGNYYNSCSPFLCHSTPNNCAGGLNSYQIPKSGNGYIVNDPYNKTATNSRTYLQAQLMDSLLQKHYYYTEFYVSLANPSKFGCDNIALYFTNQAVYADTSINKFNVISANPQILNYGNPIIADTLNWIKVSGIFKAQGGEQYLTLGNFKYDNQTQYTQFLPTGYACAGYYIDDVSLIPLDSFNLKADAGKDTTITLGDSAFIGSYTNGIDSLKWQLQNTGIAIDSTRPGFWVKPLVSTCYVLTQTVNGFTSSDTVCVNVGTVPLKFISFTASPTPPKEGLNNVLCNWQTANEINVSHFNVQHSINGRDFIKIGTQAAQNKNYNVYSFLDDKLPFLTTDQLTLYYRLQSIDKDGKVSYSEIKTLNFKPQTFKGFSLYPNPAKDVVNIECKDGIKEVKVINQIGKVAYIKGFQSPSFGGVGEAINLKQLAKGIYIVQVITQKGELKNEKLIVE